MIEPGARGKSSRQLPAWQFCYWTAVVALFAWAAWQRFALPLDPIADPDTWGYLSPALRKLIGQEFGHSDGRNFVYPAFLFLVLRVFGDFRAIVITQHLLGLAAGGMFLMIWRSTAVFLKNSRLPRASHETSGLVATAIFLVASEPVLSEMQLRPEGVCTFLVSINLFLGVQFIAACFINENRQAAVGFGIGTVFTAVLLASVKPSFVFVALVALVPVGIFFFRRGWIWQKIAVAGGGALGAALLLLPEYFLSRDDEASRTFLPTTLFVVHANLIRDQIADDLKSGAQIPYHRDWLGRVHGQLAAEIAKSSAAHPGHFPSLGFCPDYLMYETSSIAAQLRQEFDNNLPALCGFYRFYYWRIWRERPLQLVKKIARQMGIFYALMCPAYDLGKTISLTTWYDQSATVLQRSAYAQSRAAYVPMAEFVRRTEGLARSAPIFQQRALVRITLSLVAGLYLPLLLSAIALSVAALFHQDLRRRLGGLATLVLFVYSYNAAACLEVAVINSLDVPRHSEVQFFFTLLAQFLAAWLLLEVLGERRHRGRSSD